MAFCLSALGLNFAGCTLGLLLRSNATTGLTTGGAGGGLCLLGLLLGLGRSFLLLAFLDRGLAGGGTGFRSL